MIAVCRGASYLAVPLGLAAWAIGLVLGVRNFSQQGMFIVGGTLAGRLGYKPLIVAGCLLRTGGFASLIFSNSLPMLLLASAATGFAGALFNPAVRAYLAADSGDRRLEAFAMFNVFYEVGILAGPLIGLALVVVDFRVGAGAAAMVFAGLTIAQLCALPQHAAGPPTEPASVLDDWRVVIQLCKQFERQRTVGVDIVRVVVLIRIPGTQVSSQQLGDPLTPSLLPSAGTWSNADEPGVI